VDALRTIRQGKGWGVSDVPVIDLGLIDKGKVWHVITSQRSPAICGASGTSYAAVERNIDAKVISLNGKPVCLKCLAKLGPVPMPSLVKTPPKGEAA
jgi:hypothetical protein